MRYLITVEYDGSAYAGWQSQKNAVAVQDVLNAALSDLFSKDIKTEGSGRTDSGVSALGQTAHFDAEKLIDPEKIPFAVNTRLPDDIRVLSATTVSDDFHARYSVKKKTYIYRFYISRILSPTRRRTHTQLVPPVDFDLMKRAAADLIGTHDFAGFSSTGSHITNTVRTLSYANLEQHGDEITLTVTGDGFLYNMVRIIAGTLAFIGKGKLPPTAIKDTLATKSRKSAGKTYPPEGLCLLKVEYEN